MTTALYLSSRATEPSSSPASDQHLESAQLGALSYETILNRLPSRTDSICKFDTCIQVVSDKADVYVQHITTNPTETQVGQAIIDALRKIPESERSSYLALDVGMSQGYFTMLPAALGFETHAFEPQPACVALVLASLKAQPNIAKNAYIHNVALGSTNGKEHLKLHARTCQMLYAGANDDSRWKEVNTEVTVAIKRLDSYLGNKRAAVIKIDVEGAEVLVLEGILESVKAKRVNSMIIEVTRRGWGAHGVSVQRGTDVFRQLFEAAAEVTYMERNAVLQDFDAFNTEIAMTQCNMHFIFT